MIEAVEFAPVAHALWTLRVFEGEVLPRQRRIPNRQVDEIVAENLVVTVGKQLTLDRLFGLSSAAALARIGVGTSSTAAALGDTALTGAVYVAFDSTPTRSGSTVTAISTFGTGTANISWNELGLDQGSATLFSRLAPIGPFNKTSAVSIVVQVQVSAS